MAENKLLIGRIPVNKGVYTSGTVYNRLSYCSAFGSTYMSLVDGNTTAPCSFNETTKLYEHTNTNVWQCIADGLHAYNAGEEIQTLSASTSIFDEAGASISANPMSVTSNPEFAFAMTDSEGKLLFGIRNDGSIYQCAVDDLTQAKLDEIVNTIGLDVQEKITNLENQVDAISAETSARISNLEVDVDTFSANTIATLAALDDALFPMKVQMSVKPNAAVTQNTISYNVKRKNISFVPDSVTVGKQITSGDVTTIATFGTASDTVVSNIQGNAEGFVIKAVKAGRTSQIATAIRYICFYGASPASGLTEEVMSGLTKVESDTVALNPQISTKNNEFIWIIVPNELFINRVTCGGFDVTFNNPVSIVTSLGTFKAYRTVNKLDVASWTLKIDGYSKFDFNYDDVDYTIYYTVEDPIENPEYQQVILDSEEKVLWGKYTDNTIYSPDLSEYETPDGTKVSKIINYIISNPS